MGYIIEKLGSIVGIIIMLLIGFAQFVFIVSWTPNSNSVYVIFLMAVGFAIMGKPDLVI
jgi:hypothetical protein